MKYALALLVAAVYVLHQDFWNWNDKSLVLGVLPVGLAYHAFYACLAATMMFILVKFAWPAKLEAEVEALGDAAIQVEGH
jgi:Protein of unknown function (DUF3311)